MGFHCLVTEVKLISHLLGEAARGGVLQGLAGGARGCYLLLWEELDASCFQNGPFHPGVSRGSSSLGRCGDDFSLPLGILGRMLGFQQAPRSRVGGKLH